MQRERAPLPLLPGDATLDSSYFEQCLLDVAIATLERGGVTTRPSTYQFFDAVDAWGFPRYPSHTVILLPAADLIAELRAFIQRNAALLDAPDCWLGTWINPFTGCYYLDITTSRVDLNEACAMARQLSKAEGRKIVALYNSCRDLTFYLWDDVRS